MEAVRRELESTESPQGIQIMCNLSGGTGSGISSALNLAIAEQYKGLDKIRFSFLSQPNVHGNLSVTPYNMINALKYNKVEEAASNVLINNERLHDACVA